MLAALKAETEPLKARVQALEAALRSIAEYDCEWDSGNCGGCASCEARACFPVETASKLNDFPTPTADMNAKGFVDPRPDFKTDGECKEHLWRLDSVTLQHRCVKCNAQKIEAKP